MPDWLSHTARATPHRLALRSSMGQWTYAALKARVDDAADVLRRQGVKPSHRVALLSDNRASVVVAIHALLRLRAVLVPLNARLKAEEMRWQLDDANATWLLVDEAYRDHPVMHHIAEDGPTTSIIDLSDMTLDQATEKSPPLLSVPDLHLNDPQCIMYTSGTTGRPKGAVLTVGNHWWSAMGSALNLGVSPDDHWLLLLPLYHIGGMAIVFRAAIYGCAVTMPSRFDARRVNALIDEGAITHVSVVSTMLQRLVDHREGRPYPSSLKVFLTGGGPVPLPLLEAAAAVNAPVLQTYGMTETASQIATLSPADAHRKPGSSGKPLAPFQLRVDAPRGQVGDIVVRGPAVSPGYVQPGSDVVLPVKDDDGWFTTGDVGYLDEDGYLFVVDRRDDLIISGGENVYPKEVERVLESHPAVKEAAVVGMRDEQWGAVPVAFVRLKEDADKNPSWASTLIFHCQNELASFKVPKQVHVVDDFPRTASGKIVRRELIK